jgi:hypothetical protein
MLRRVLVNSNCKLAIMSSETRPRGAFKAPIIVYRGATVSAQGLPAMSETNFVMKLGRRPGGTMVDGRGDESKATHAVVY